jgi:hypothetical protein
VAYGGNQAVTYATDPAVSLARPRRIADDRTVVGVRKVAPLLIFIAACSTEPINDRPDPIDEAIDNAYRDATCNFMVKCGLIEDLATCARTVPIVGFDQLVRAAIRAGKVIFHADKVAACTNGGYEGCSRIGNFDFRPEACSQILEGTVVDGGQCALNEECVSQHCFVPTCSDACCRGFCDSASFLDPHLGDACTAAMHCVNSFCDSTTMICTAYLADGSACGDSSQCWSGYCENNICTRRLPETGEDCTAYPLCRLAGDTCSPLTKKCTPYSLAGEPCAVYGNPVDSGCAPYHRCNTGNTTQGTCELKVAPTLGESCESSSSGCIDDSYCSMTLQTCVVRNADGEPCSVNEQCQSLRCSLQTCAAVCI